MYKPKRSQVSDSPYRSLSTTTKSPSAKRPRASRGTATSPNISLSNRSDPNPANLHSPPLKKSRKVAATDGVSDQHDLETFSHEKSSNRILIDDLNTIQDSILSPLSFRITSVIPDTESADYDGHTFTLSHHKDSTDGSEDDKSLKIDKQYNVLYRRAKITPTKVGQFVAIWKRISQQPPYTCPFSLEDPYDFYLISISSESNHSGFFLFPRVDFHLPIGVISRYPSTIDSISKDGKRGFRLYPPWSPVANNTAKRTQKLQIPYFIDTSVIFDDSSINTTDDHSIQESIMKFKNIINQHPDDNII